MGMNMTMTNPNPDPPPLEFLVIGGPHLGSKVVHLTGTATYYRIADGELAGREVRLRSGWVRAIGRVGGVSAGPGGGDGGAKDSGGGTNNG